MRYLHFYGITTKLALLILQHFTANYFVVRIILGQEEALRLLWPLRIKVYSSLRALPKVPNKDKIRGKGPMVVFARYN